MCTFKHIAITNRHLCQRPFLVQLEKILPTVDMVILREKDLNEEEYGVLAEKVLQLCGDYHVECVLHTYTETARRLKCRAIHLPLPLFREQSFQLQDFELVGTSVHSLEEAKEAERLGAGYITASHIFETDCKKGLTPRGTDFLKEICGEVNIPVYALGGINDENEELIVRQGADGACRMSFYMQTK